LKYILLLLLSFINFSCVKEIEITKNEDDTHIISLFSLFTIGKENQIKIINTQKINDTTKQNYNQLKLTVSTNNQQVDFIKYDGLDYFENANFYFEENQNYEVNLYNGEKLIAKSNDYIPSKPNVTDAYYTFIVGPESNDKYLFEFKIQDEPKKENYYEVIFINVIYDQNKNETNYSCYYNLSRSNIVLDNEGDLANDPIGLLFSDDLFKDSIYNFNIEVTNTGYDLLTKKGKGALSTGRHLLIRSLSKNYYTFNKSWNAHNRNRIIKKLSTDFEISTIFPSSPVGLYSNVSVGIGGFLGYQELIIPIKER
jgi:hypothetical protein